MARVRKFSSSEIFSETKKLLLSNGYNGFTIRLLADALDVSRAAIYKYYTNKDELIMDFMIHEMSILIGDLKEIDQTARFEVQMDNLLACIFKMKNLHEILGIASIISDSGNGQVARKKERLEELHKSMYRPMERMIALGKDEGVLSDHLPDALILGFIFQSIAIPNHMNLPEKDFRKLIIEMICTGIYKSSKVTDV
ncbi:TetR/AcrR family transcriptional regulator [Pradoshia sp.]